MRQIILDTETTGLSPEEGHRIIEIGCLEMVDRQLTGNHLHFYVNPERAIEQDALQIHGITEKFLLDKPLFKDIADQLIDFLSGAELIIHNAPFDVGFINYELGLTKRSFKLLQEYCQIIDSLAIARHKHPGQQNSLDALCRRYGVDNMQRDLHGALLDAQLLAQVYLLMTGGQSQLFDLEANSTTLTQETRIRRRIKRTSPLPVIKPTAEELAAHESLLSILKHVDVSVGQNDDLGA